VTQEGPPPTEDSLQILLASLATRSFSSFKAPFTSLAGLSRPISLINLPLKGPFPSLDSELTSD